MPLPWHSPDTPTTPVPCLHIGPDGTPRHAHGNRSTYRFDNCRCLPCRESIRVYDRTARRTKAYGKWQPYADVKPVSDHARALRAAGLTIAHIAAASGVGHAAIGRILTGRDRGQPVTRVKTETAERVLAVPVPTPTAAPPPWNVPAVGTARRIQALMAIGWPLPVIVRHAGLSAANASRLLTREKVTRDTDAAVRRVYEALWNKTPQAVTATEETRIAQAIDDARRRRYAPPMAWDDGTIDDPAARPQGTVGTLTGRRAAIVEDCELIASDGGTLQAAAQRLGMHQSNLTRSLYRAGRADLVAALTRQARGEDAPGGTRGVARSRRARAS